MPKRFDKANAVVALGVFLGALVVYVRTMAPTLSFWDCGEFIATAHIFGIPHPPGTPTFLLATRLASALPLFSDIAVRVNFVSALCSAIAALFGYLVAVRIIRYWYEEPLSVSNRIVIYGGAACGAFLLAFGLTQWNNAVETECYGMSMALLFAIAWLTLVYFEHRDTLKGERLMLLAVYLAYLGIGVHMTTFMIMPISAVVFMLKKGTPARVWYMVGAFFLVELLLIFTLSSKTGEIPYCMPAMVAAAIYLFYILSFDNVPRESLMVGLGFAITILPGLATLAGIKSPVWTMVGALGYVALVGYALYLGALYLKESRARKPERTHRAVAVVFVVVSAVLSLMLLAGLRGYTVFLFISVLLVVGLAAAAWRYIKLPVVIALLGPAMIILGVREFFWGIILAALAIVLLGLVWRASYWKAALLAVVVAALGYSTHVVLPIRSRLDPYINENNPGSSLETTINFIERKQYGSESMVPRMFERRGEWENQFGTYRRMGFWGFFETQYGVGPRWFIPVFLLGIFGLWETCRRKPPAGVFLFTLILVTTVGLVLYMNFADGMRRDPLTGGDWLEVRDRDYFFTPGFMLFGLAIGLGAAGLVQFLRDVTAKFSAAPRAVIATVPLVLFLLPTYALATNYYLSDRSRNYIPYDYARNMLLSCDQDAVLFTFGDNDTFPLWCVQEAYGIRKDVRLICCALANGQWYIKQIRDNMGVDLGWSDQQIDSLRAFRAQDGRVVRLQDQVVDAVIVNNYGKRPICFSPIGGRGTRVFNGQNIDSLIIMKGLVFCLADSIAAGARVDVPRSMELFTNEFQYRGWNDSTIHLSDESLRALQGVAGSMLTVSEALLRMGEIDSALQLTRLVAEKIPVSTDALESYAGLLAEKGDTAALLRFTRDVGPIETVYQLTLLGRAYRKAGDTATATAILRDALQRYPSSREALNEIMSIYIDERAIPEMVEVLQEWLVSNPNDSDIRTALEELQKQLDDAISDSSRQP